MIRDSEDIYGLILLVILSPIIIPLYILMGIWTLIEKIIGREF